MQRGIIKRMATGFGVNEERGQRTPQLSNDRGHPQLIRFADHGPKHSSRGTDSWVVRGQDFVVVYSDAGRADTLVHTSGYEYLLAVPDSWTRIELSTDHENIQLHGPATVVIPPGNSVIRILNPGVVIRIFTSAADQLMDRSINAQHYRSPRPIDGTRPPEAVADRLRPYQLRNFPTDPSVGGHAFRSTNLMINWIPPICGESEVITHPDQSGREQYLIQLEGHFRYRMDSLTAGTTAREQERQLSMNGPGVLIVPALLTFTRQAIGPGAHTLMQIFAPPPGDLLTWPERILNSDEFPSTTQP